MQGSEWKRRACTVLWACLLAQGLGCAVQRTSERAATGAIESLALPGHEEEFRRNVQLLAQRLVKEALEATPPPGAEALAQRTSQGFIQGFQAHFEDPRNRAWLRELVHTSVAEALAATRGELRNFPPPRALMAEGGAGLSEGLVQGLAAQQQDVALIADTVARQLTRTLSDQFQVELRAQLSDPEVVAAVEQLARRASAAAVQGATAELGRTLPACAEGVEGPCVQQLTAQVSRSALSGIFRAVWPLALLGVAAFALGVLVAAAFRRRPVST